MIHLFDESGDVIETHEHAGDYGGGIWNYGAGSGSATATINNSTLSGNSASSGGSRVFLVNNAVTVTISGLTITNGRAPDFFPYGGNVQVEIPSRKRVNFTGTTPR